MNEDWANFLRAAGAEFSAEGIASFGNPLREISVALTGVVFADLSHYGLISAQGEEAESFLLAQFTNDLKQVNEKTSQLTGYCNPKGRLLAIMRAFKRDDSLYLSLPASMTEPTLKRLRMFVLRAKVTLEDAGDTYIHLGASGNGVDTIIRDTLGLLPESVNQVAQNHESLVIQVPGPMPRYEIYTSKEMAKSVWNALNVGGAPIASDAWALLNVQAGIPEIVPETTETFIPQMINLQLIDGVSFKKGCYPGQEIVARMQYLGKLKKRMYAAMLLTSQAPAPGSDIYQQGKNQPVGKVVSLAPHPDSGYALLAVLQIKSAEDVHTELYIEGDDSTLLALTKLPYAFPNDDDG